MGRNHQEWIRQELGAEVFLFNRLCYGIDQPILDIHEAIPDWPNQPERVRGYLGSVIDHIWNGVLRLLAHLPSL